MTTPQALALADKCEESAASWLREIDTRKQAAALLRTQHAEIERLNAAVKWEQNRAERIGTHGPGCRTWGPAHYECLLRTIERKDALLRQAVNMFSQCIRYDFDDEPLDEFDVHAKDLCDAITKELAK